MTDTVRSNAPSHFSSGKQPTSNPLHDSSSSLAYSEASTALHDNRSSRPIRPFFASTKPRLPPSRATEDPLPESVLLPPVYDRTTSTTAIVQGDNDNDDDDDDDRRDTDSSITPTPWEEEATPEQTAFGKQLLLAREQMNQSVLSTASEMGTVVDMEQRIADLEEEDVDDKDILPNVPPSPQSPSRYSVPIGWDSELSLPVLDDTEQRAPSSSSPRKDGGILTSLRRMGAGVMSAPTTPRRPSPSRTIQPSKSFQRSHSAHSRTSSSFQPRTPSSFQPLTPSSTFHPRTPSSTVQPRTPSNVTPSSFLLRSPGSAAFLASTATHINGKRKSRLKNGMLTPRFAFGKIAEERTIIQQAARSCFSFDDTCMDEQFEVDLPPEAAAVRASASWDGGASAFRPLHRPHLASRPTVEQQQQQQYLHLAESPVRVSQQNEELKTPQRIEIEREDALDILSCLVERGVSTSDVGETGGDVMVEEDKKEANEDVSMDALIKEMKEALGGVDSGKHKALDELLRSHEYAMEMKRASKSAKSWLSSIDREREAADVSPNTRLGLSRLSPVTPKSPGGDMDLMTAQAMMRTAQVEAQEKTVLADRLNEELAKCRAEIGRLRSASQANAFRSPNRSILDESADEEESDEDSEKDKSFDSAMPIVGIDETGFLNSPDAPETTTPDVSREVSRYKAALEDANEKIRQLQNQLKDVSSLTAPIAPPSSGLLSKDSPGNKEERTINVRMLDGENFVTEWTDLTTPLPPPPEHDLRSPIVAAVLDQWTEDKSLHKSLFDWMDQVTEGRSDSITPLTLSNLDHQVRDGFLMHVLPILLRRADIRVDVQTRARRTTTYDVSVTVEPSFMLRQRHWENVAAHSDVGGFSTATTTLASNRPRNTDDTSRRLTYDEIAESGIGVEPHPGLMSALGGALGGLLTRNRPANKDNTVGEPATFAMAEKHLTFDEDDAEGGSTLDMGDQPYHRVVSAPAGRIGVTFVEYKGHAMVSDVSNDSPLVGWMFPTDVLIAIDELPVNGMKLREIIKILKDRQGRQRALRVISSHGMADPVALNTSHQFVESG